MITLHQYSPNWDLPNASPFCMKLETYGDRTDAYLSPSDRGISVAMRRMIDENLYWCLVYSR